MTGALVLALMIVAGLAVLDVLLVWITRNWH